MGHELDADYRQQYLLPPSIEDWVPPNASVRFIRTFVEELKAKGLELREAVSNEGRPRYSSWLLLRIWLYAYQQGISATREVERAVRERMPMIWLAGGLRPDHNTLWRFWQEHHTTIRELFGKSVAVAADLNLVGFVLQAVDGTKLQSASSTRRAMNRGEAEALLRRLNVKIEQLETSIANAGAGGEDVDELAASLTERAKLREKVAEALSAWSDPECRQNISEPDARMMHGVGLGYNAQAVVDAAGQIIVAEQVVTDSNDQHQLVPMLEQVESTYGRVAEETLADGGYNTVSAVGEAEQKNYPVLLANSPHEPDDDAAAYHSSRFHYDDSRDVVICPQGEELTYERSTQRKHQSYAVRIFRGRACAACPVREACTKDRRGRTIEVSPYQAAVERQREKRRSSESRALYKKRLHLAERPFAVIKRTLGFKRFRMKSLEKVRDEWAFVCAVFNMTQIAAFLRRTDAV